MSAALETCLAAARAHGGEPKRSGDGWAARCPVHDDRQASLSISEGGDGRALIFCHACGKDATPAIIEAWGLTMADLAPPCHASANGHAGPRQARRILDRYQYHDRDGMLLMEIVRYDGIGKRPRRPDTNG